LTLGAGVHVAETDGLAWRRAGRGRLAYEVRARHPRGGGRCACRLRDGSPGAVLKPTSRTAGTNRTGRDEPERLLDEGWFAEGETTTMPARLYGRNTVLTRINRMLDSLRERRGDALLIEGAPGSGRTRLIDAAEAVDGLLTASRGAAVGVLLAARSVIARPDLHEMLDRARPPVSRCLIEPLTGAAVEQLATDAFGAPPSPELLRWLWTASGEPRLTVALI